MLPPITPELLSALKDFKRQHPWTGDLVDRKNKFMMLHRRFNELFDKDVDLDLTKVRDGFDSGQSYAARHSPPKIGIVGKLSVITFIHEWAHILGANETDAQTWALDLYKQTFPKNFAKLKFAGTNRFATMEVSEW